MTPEIKVVYSDLDGTLLSPKKHSWKKVKTYTLSTLSVFLENSSNHFILATGRNLARTKSISNWLENRLGGYKIPYLICLNGGLLFDNREGKIIHTQTFKCSQLLKLLSFLRRHYFLVYFIVDSSNQLFVENNWISRVFARKFAKKYNATIKFNTPENYKNGWEGIQKVLFFTFHKNSSKLRILIETQFSEFYVSIHGDWLLEVIDRKVNKFFAIQRINEIEGWELEECCAIGNEHNDLMMIEKCGFGVAVDFSPEHTTFNYDNTLINFNTTNKYGLAVANVINHLT
ncbi:haloacid dehalogenase-like hydrolase family protein [Mycoplasma wenyonii str. Massachusetts]|uniref:Haloacid dehalogenase-like hydrolase family protein n=2 Tax=Mycoplasma wenyonii TaxID=65123 RepID=I6Z5X8_MYCWM|nr:haloacid dehalogenase-like hydrolase family protein [Mycoplasma wenyonii str. Massachusetts]